MKTLSDGIEVAARGYYYMLDWNEVNEWAYMYETFDKKRLCDLTIKEYAQLFSYSTQIDLISLRDK